MTQIKVSLKKRISFSHLFSALPYDLKIANETDKKTIIGTEHQILKLICNVESGIPPETITWKLNKRYLKRGGPKRNIYRFVPDRTHHNSNLTCEVTNSLTKMPITKTVQLDIKCTYTLYSE